MVEKQEDLILPVLLDCVLYSLHDISPCDPGIFASLEDLAQVHHVELDAIAMNTESLGNCRLDLFHVFPFVW